MTPAERKQIELRAAALQMDVMAAVLKMNAAAARMTAAFVGFSGALADAIDSDEREALFGHPDLIELDLKDAAWNPE